MPRTVKRNHNLSIYLMTAAVALLLVGIWTGFVIDHQLSIPQQVAAHILIMLAGGLLKLGYVLRLVSEDQAHHWLAH